LKGSLTGGYLFHDISAEILLRRLIKSTGVLGNICGPVLCYGHKGQTEKKGGHLPYTLHLSLSCQLSQWVMQTLIWLDDWLHYHFFSFFFLPGFSDFTEVAVVHCSFQVKHKGPGLRFSALLNFFHLELLAFSHLVKSSSPYPTHCS